MIAALQQYNNPTMPAPIIAGLGAAGIAAAVGKSAATVGLSAAGGVTSYYIIDAARGKDEPMIGHAILTTASETNSDSLGREFLRRRIRSHPNDCTYSNRFDSL